MKYKNNQNYTETNRKLLFIFKSMHKDKGESWIKRCFKRLPSVRPFLTSLHVEYWIIKGDVSLGDHRSMYIVSYDKKRKIYTCSCYNPLRKFSRWRQKRTCTHVGAVMLYKLRESLKKENE